MKDKIYSKNYYICFHECDMFNRIQYHIMLAKLCETAGLQLDNKGITRDKMIELNQVFFLMGISVRLDKIPRYNDIITIRTWEIKNVGAKFLRGFDILDEKRSVIGDAYSVWGLVNLETRKIFRAKEYFFESDFVDKKVVATLEKIRMTNGVKICNHIFTYDEIDANGHVNNGVYLKLAINSIPFELQKKGIKYFTINYYSEANLGEYIDIFKSEDGNIIQIYGEFQDGKRNFEIQIEICAN